MDVATVVIRAQSNDDGPAFDGEQWKSEPFGVRALIDNGFLWAFNRYCLHPRGFALSWSEDLQGFELWGDGTAPWSFGAEVDADRRSLFEATLARLTEDYATKVADTQAPAAGGGV